jgi:hypothetical protein
VTCAGFLLCLMLFLAFFDTKQRVRQFTIKKLNRCDYRVRGTHYKIVFLHGRNELIDSFKVCNHEIFHSHDSILFLVTLVVGNSCVTRTI